MNDRKINGVFFCTRIVILFHSLSSNRRSSTVFTHSDFKMVLSFPESIASTSLKFLNNARTYKNRNFIFECEKSNQLALSLEYNLNMAIRELH